MADEINPEGAKFQKGGRSRINRTAHNISAIARH